VTEEEYQGIGVAKGGEVFAAVVLGEFRSRDFRTQPKTYGWIYLIVAAVLIVCAVLGLSGSQVARLVGVVAGAIIAIGAPVIYALVVYGGKTEAA
jgi:hypothetical protein